MSVQTKLPTKAAIIPGFHLYTIHPITQEIQNIETGTILKQFGKEYNKVNLLHNNGIRKTPLVARLMAATFIPNPKKLPKVFHLNGNTLDDRVSNLKFGTQHDCIVNALRIKNKYQG